MNLAQWQLIGFVGWLVVVGAITWAVDRGRTRSEKDA